jgi:hypothetical protein
MHRIVLARNESETFLRRRARVRVQLQHTVCFGLDRIQGGDSRGDVQIVGRVPAQRLPPQGI